MKWETLMRNDAHLQFVAHSSPRETCDHEGHVVQTQIEVCGVQIAQVCTRCGLSV